MGKLMGVKQIEMYEGMVLEEFAPVIGLLRARTDGIRPVVEQEVKKRMGVYSLFEERAALQVRLNEIDQKLNDATVQRWTNGTRKSKLEVEVDKALDELNTPLTDAERVRNGLIKQIRLSGIGDEVRTVFEALEKEVKALAEKVEMLPPLTAESLFAIAAPSEE